MKLNHFLVAFLCWHSMQSSEAKTSFPESRIENDALVVQLEHGWIRGKVGQTVDLHKTFYYFRGIPYALPPIGALRFRPPVPVNYSKTLRYTNKEPSSCVQGLLAVEGSEDCLYMNVYTPNLPSLNSTKLPVMVWLYGGSFNSGNSSYTLYGPDYLLDEDVVVAMFNYRLGIFGYLSTNDSAAPGNFGLKDQFLALKWVKSNIEKFGGDANKITIFGESAGAASISYFLQTHLTQGLFHGAIMESGTALCPWSLARNSKEIAFEVASAFSLNTTTTEALVDGLKGVDYKRLQMVSGALADMINPFPKDGIVFSPVQEADGVGALITGKSYELLQQGQFSNVPTIIGLNSQEGGFFDINLFIRLILLSYTDPVLILPPKDMNLNSTEIRLIGEMIKQRYFHNTSVGLATATEIAQFITDELFVVPIRKTVELISRKTHVYFYRFSYEGQLGNFQNRETPGAVHTEELQYLFRKTYDNSTVKDRLIRSRMVKLWTNFAKYGNPTPHTDFLLENITWPSAGAIKDGNLTFLDIGNHLRISTNLEEETVQFFDHLYRTYGHPPFTTY